MAHPPKRPSGPYRPTRLGDWEVIAKIAGGGMSAVYLGRRVEPLADIPNVVALKIMRHDVHDERLTKMFLAEGRLIARLVHPNIVRTHEVGSDGEQNFIAMELMLGKTFAAIQEAVATRGVRLNADIAAWAAARVADALHCAHELTDERGQPLALVHRDVNPANVFATFRGEVKLFDFGLAKVTAGEVTGSSLLAGKLSYLSPEQIMQMPLDRRSDIFSLGTTFWELLTGKRLFRRDSDVETVRAVQLGPIPDPRTVAPDVPEELARIARTSLERNREHRYPTVAHLARELDAFVLQRSSPADLVARLAQLVDTLFPGEQKRQSGWLKPAITSTTRPASGIPGPWSTRPMPPEHVRDTREVTAVSSGNPLAPATMRESRFPATEPDGVPAALSGLPPPSTPRVDSRSLPRFDSTSIPRYDSSSIPRFDAASIPRFDAIPTSGSAPPTLPESSLVEPPPHSAHPRSARPGPPSTPPRPPPRAMAPRTSSPPMMSAGSKTDIQTIPPRVESRTDVQTLPLGGGADPPSAHERETLRSLVAAPPVVPSKTPPTGTARPAKRAPIPLPSRTKKDAPARTDAPRRASEAPPQRESQTQVDIIDPPKGKR